MQPVQKQGYQLLLSNVMSEADLAVELAIAMFRHSLNLGEAGPTLLASDRNIDIRRRPDEDPRV